MKKQMFVVCSLLLIAGCNNSPKQSVAAQNQAESLNKSSFKGNIAHQTIQYRIDSDQYGVVIVQKGGITSREAKQFAMEKAAFLTRQNNYRYFTIELEEKVLATDFQVRKGENLQVPRNMYYELIQSSNFGKGSIDENNNIPVAALYPAYKMVIRCYKEKPIAGAIDARELPVNYR